MTKLEFMSVESFKTQTQSSKLEIVRNPNTGKLFVADSHGNYYRCQQDIDSKLPMKFLREVGASSADWCLANVKESQDIVQFVL